jgi:hypothetical protein
MDYIVRVSIGDDDWLHETDADSAEAALREVRQTLREGSGPSPRATFAFLGPREAYEFELARQRREAASLRRK